LSTWSGTGTVAGSGDSETLTLSTGQFEESVVWQVGVGTAEINLNTYSGIAVVPTIEYKTGNSIANCEADTWTTYSGGSFESSGWAKIRVSR
jgi:hypothetical protein